MPYVSADRSLPRSLDVQISVSRPQTETRTDLTILCIAMESLGFLPNSNRIRFYSTIEAVEDDFASGTPAQVAAAAFFAQSPRATQMALGEVFLADQPAYLAAAARTAAQLLAIKAITNGSMDVVYDIGGGLLTYNYTGLDFSAIVTIEDVVAVLTAAEIYGDPITAGLKTLPGGAQLITLTADGVGDGVTIAYPIAAAGGTFVGDLLGLTSAEGGSLLLGYSPTGIGDELSSIQNAATASSKFIYGWCLGASLRTDAIQIAAAAWALPRVAIIPLVTNSTLAYDSSYVADIGTVITATGNKRAVCIYHDNEQRYPDVSILAYMLHVNYRLAASVATAKFKILPGVETVQLTETELSNLQAKGYNTYTAIGNDARTYRDGETSEATWWMDSVINLDNFVEDLSVNVFNVFLRNKIVPYTSKGQLLIVDACKDTGNQYEYNGTFSDREVADTTKKGGIEVIDAVVITPTPVANASAADRASRVAPPITMTVYEAGAMHEVAISVEVVS